MVKTTVVLVPGLDGTGELFGPVIGALGEDFAPTIVRYGDDLKPFEAHVDDVVAALDAAPGPSLVVAESFGGPVATTAAARRPDKVRALLLVATFVTRPTATVLWMRPWLRLFHRAPVPRPVRGRIMRLTLGDAGLRGALLEQLVAVNSGRADVLWHRMGLVAVVDARAALHALPCPVAYVGGTADRIVPVRRHAAQIAALRPDARIQLIQGGPHMLLQCQPRACVAVAQELLDATTMGKAPPRHPARGA